MQFGCKNFCKFGSCCFFESQLFQVVSEYTSIHRLKPPTLILPGHDGELVSRRTPEKSWEPMESTEQIQKLTAHTNDTGFWYQIAKQTKNSKSLRVFLEALQESPALDYLKARHKVLLPRFSTCFTFVPFVGGLWRAHFGEAEDQATFTNSSSSVEPPCGCPLLSRTAK